MGLSGEQIDVIQYLFLAFGVVGICVTSFLAFSIVIFRKYRKLSVRLVLVLTFILMGQSIGWIVCPWVLDYYGLCYFQALVCFLLFFFFISSSLIFVLSGDPVKLHCCKHLGVHNLV